jgi:hypothetical protein
MKTLAFLVLVFLFATSLLSDKSGPFLGTTFFAFLDWTYWHDLTVRMSVF